MSLTSIRFEDVVEYAIDLVAASRLFGRGHRWRVDIAGSNIALFDRNMNTGNPAGEDATGPLTTIRNTLRASTCPK